MTDSRPTHPDVVDVVVIGAGPAGTTAAAKLAQAGRSVLLLESRSLPRFHVGESLLPKTMPLLDELGVLSRIKGDGHVTKHGAEFISPAGDYKRIPFRNSALQVERARFDYALADFARESGATLLQQATVHELVQDGDRVVGVRYQHEDETHEVRATQLIDAGGRGSKVAKTFGLRKPIEKLRMVAVFQHFTGLDERHNPGHEGDIQVGAHADGWLWAIPIRKDTISLGAVTPQPVLRAGSPEEILREHAARVERITQRITGTEPIGEHHIEGDYCYYADTVAGDGWFLAGDAGCFFDPIFSGGVHLAVSTGMAAAKTVDAILADPDRTEELRHWYQNFYKTGYDTNGRIVYGYYQQAHDLKALVSAVGLGDIREEENRDQVQEVIAGGFWEDNKFLELMRAESAWDTFASFEPTGPALPQPAHS